MSPEGSELLEAVRQMKATKRGREYSPEQRLAISARKSLTMTQTEFASLLNVSVDAIQDWEQGRRKPRGPAQTLLRIAEKHPKILSDMNNAQ
ncbi:MAG: helix-turn-helix domain-containing protein [Gammaproteobacteria bacterium]